MRAAFPYIDDFLPAGTVASLERLGEILSGVRAGDPNPGREAAAHVAPDVPAGGAWSVEPPSRIGAAGDPTMAQPLEAGPRR
jgi:hypothetical protein